MFPDVLHTDQGRKIEGPRQAAEPHPVVIEPGRARPVRDRRKPDHYGHNIYDT